MAVQPEGMKYFTAEVVSVKGECHAGHKPGDILKLGCWDPGGLCGFFYHNIFPDLSVLQFGGRYPWAAAGELTLECPDRRNLVTIKVKQVERTIGF
ncbi:MAG: TIGR04076 family protein [Deltaproteobacteria bacterium]|nr:TIGR04076 family protein [Deltaproteobacteria bacterium]